MSLLSEHSKQSSMRLNMLLVGSASVVILLSVAAYIIVMAIKGIEITQWSGMGVFCIGMATVVTGVTYTKALQKKHENGEPKLNAS